MSRVGLRTILLVAILIAGVTPALVLVPVFFASSRAMTTGLVAETLTARSHHVSVTLARGLYDHWRDIEGAAQQLGVDQPVDELRSALEDIRRSHEQFDWVGVASIEGNVVAANAGILEGADVAARPWFRGGLQGPFAGDVHEAVLLQRILQPDGGEPLRFVDLAAPLLDDGTPMGVIGAHLNWNWLIELVEQIQRDNIEIILVARDGTILLGPDGLEGTTADVPSLRAAQQGSARSFLESWPDGKSYLSAVTPTVSYRNLPSFGWSIVVRQPADTALMPLRLAARNAVVAFLAALGVLVLLGVLLGGWIAQPVRRIARNVDAAAAGIPQPPLPQAQRYREASVIDAAFQRLQSTIGLRPPE
jgi:hypothetical protein